MKRGFKVSKGRINSFSISCSSKKTTWTKLLKWLFMLVNWASGRLQNLHWWWRWSDVWRCRKAMRTNFLHRGHRKKQLCRSCISDILSRRLTLTTHIQPSRCVKNDLGEADEMMFQGVERPCEIIFDILFIEKSDLYEVKWWFMLATDPVNS
jgi:hypothetical protein